MPPRIGPHTLQPADKARRYREGRAAYVRALEEAVRDAADNVCGGGDINDWREMHAPVIERARRSVERGE